MPSTASFEIFLATAPGLEPALCNEARALGFSGATVAPGGVTVQGTWPDVWRANLEVRGANRVVARVAEFRAFHLAQLDKRARRVPWGEILRNNIPIRVEATCRESKIYHSGAAAQRVERAIKEELGSPVSKDADICVRVRIADDLVTLGVDTSGEQLHKRGFKEAVNKAPMRETMAALFLRQCGYTGTEPVLDPMCGSGTFVIEAAEIALGLKPGRERAFAFEHLATFDRDAWIKLKAASPAPKSLAFKFFGSDRDAGAITMSQANAARAGVSAITEFHERTISDITPPAGQPGLVVVNPPYGDRIGDKSKIRPLYHALGQTLLARFSGWRVGIITTDATLARATGLPFLPTSAPVAHGGLRVTLFHTLPLP